MRELEDVCRESNAKVRKRNWIYRGCTVVNLTADDRESEQHRTGFSNPNVPIQVRTLYLLYMQHKQVHQTH